ncbi:hypothetical protein [Corynebacterium poyangense]|uniref:hypothetical protein n=1 Tax=Corynebacterium poyangense TaxID=2684405 RepID=UPI001CCE1B0D|nr:hypothetical protein [Corynebacterium poyangense]
MTDKDGVTEASKQATLSNYTPPALARFSSILRNRLFSLDGNNDLSSINLTTGAEEYRFHLNINGPSPISITYEGSLAYIVVRPDDIENKQAVMPIKLLEPSCQGEFTPLIGYDDMTQNSRLSRMGNTFKVATTVLPIDKDFSFSCS